MVDAGGGGDGLDCIVDVLVLFGGVVGYAVDCLTVRAKVGFVSAPHEVEGDPLALVWPACAEGAVALVECVSICADEAFTGSATWDVICAGHGGGWCDCWLTCCNC